MGKLNLCFRECPVENSVPGKLLSADSDFIGSLKGADEVCLHAVASPFGSYANGFLWVFKQPQAAVAILQDDMLHSFLHLDLR